MEKTLANIDFWKTVELESEDLPSNINETATQAQVESKTVNIMVRITCPDVLYLMEDISFIYALI